MKQAHEQAEYMLALLAQITTALERLADATEEQNYNRKYGGNDE